jgi:2-keto-3-deoxy-L-rhamnonate aldolase RhmA
MSSPQTAMGGVLRAEHAGVSDEWPGDSQFERSAIFGSSIAMTGEIADGELMLWVKIEDKYAAANVEEILKIPGIKFGENGGADLALSFGFKGSDPVVRTAEAKNLN